MNAKPSERVAIVTGASGSIGAMTALTLAQQGSDLVIHYHSNQKIAQQVVQKVRALGRKAVALSADVRVPEQVMALVAEAEETLGRVDVLVNNAGVQRNGLLVTMSRDDWDEVVEVNLSGTLYFCKAVAPGMVARGSGRIINIASITGMVAQKLRANYGASKRGVIGLTRALARELAPRGVLVNAIAPQVVKGGLSAQSSLWELHQIKGMSPLGRFAMPHDVAGLVAFLAGDQCGYLAGSVFNLTGGLVTWE